MADDLVLVAPLRFEAAALRYGKRVARPHRSGMGAERARRAGLAIAAAPRRPVAIAGVAGALDPRLRPGQVVVATEVIGDRLTVLRSAAPLAAQLRRAGLDVVTGPIVSTRSIARRGERTALWEQSGAIATDLESAWLVEALDRVDPREVAVVRVIVDTPQHDIWSPRTVTEGARAARILNQIGPVLTVWSAALGPREVTLAGPRSFCAGVERAIDVVRRALDRFGAPVYVRRQIVHNTHVVRELEALGAVFVQELDEVPDGSTVVLAAHGVAPEVREGATTRPLRVIDATCPLVAKVHSEARRYARDGYSIVLIGHDDHEEIIGTRGEAPERIAVVEDMADVAALDLPDPGKVAYLTQTTLALDETASVVAALKDRFPLAVGPRADDICYASQNRQEAVRAIAASCDVIVVVGSANSSNSNRLVEVARRAGCRAYLVDTQDDIDLAWLADSPRVGVSAGASAPEFIVRDVVTTLEALGPLTVIEHEVAAEGVHFQLPAEVR